MKHRDYIALALEEAKLAYDKGEVPVGALVVLDGEVIGVGHNLVETRVRADAHAEVIALNQAANSISTKSLQDCSLYSTLEPCPMCAFAAILYRIDTIVYGASDPKFGGCGSIVNLPAEGEFNHTPQVIAGVMEKECGDILRKFFQNKRQGR